MAAEFFRQGLDDCPLVHILCPGENVRNHIYRPPDR